MKMVLCIIAAVMFCAMAASQNTLMFKDAHASQHLRGGIISGGKLHLVATPSYAQLSEQDRREILAPISKAVGGLDVVVCISHTERELWRTTQWGLRLVEHWDNDSLQIEAYRPLELKRNGESTWFYAIGGTLGGTRDQSSGTLNLRCGSYMFKNKADVSLALNLGYMRQDDTTQSTADLGLNLRYYLPWRLPNVGIVPYAGAGVAWAMAPFSYFEMRLLCGGCWFLGSVGIDLGLQYGLKSHLSAMLGLTIRSR